jgi:Apea-like HEPN
MKVSITFFAGIDQIELPNTSRKGIDFGENYILTSHRAHMTEIVSPFTNFLGSVEMSYLTQGGAKALVYRKIERDIDNEDIGDSLRKLLINDMLFLKNKQLLLWMMKDNAVHFDRSWIVANATQNLITNNNVWETRHSCADGTFNSMRFTLEELRIDSGHMQTSPLHIQSSDAPTMLVRNSLRFQRFQYFIDIARSSADVAMKLAQYCSGLEALVSTANQELTHQVSERVAVALTEIGAERIKIFKQVKDAYKYRSQVVHGKSFKERDFDKIVACSLNVDGICRMLVGIYFDTTNGFRAAMEDCDEVVNDFFVTRTFGVH